MRFSKCPSYSSYNIINRMKALKILVIVPQHPHLAGIISINGNIWARQHCVWILWNKTISVMHAWWCQEVHLPARISAFKYLLWQHRRTQWILFWVSVFHPWAKRIRSKLHHYLRQHDNVCFFRVKAVRGGGDWLKGGEGISQRTYTKDPWICTVVRGLIMEVGGRWGVEGGRGGNVGQL